MQTMTDVLFAIFHGRVERTLSDLPIDASEIEVVAWLESDVLGPDIPTVQEIIAAIPGWQAEVLASKESEQAKEEIATANKETAVEILEFLHEKYGDELPESLKVKASAVALAKSKVL